MQKDLDDMHQSNAALRHQISEGEGQSSQNNSMKPGRRESRAEKGEPGCQTPKSRSTVKRLQDTMAALEKKCELMQKDTNSER
jgi:hypothetical protein